MKKILVLACFIYSQALAQEQKINEKTTSVLTQVAQPFLFSVNTLTAENASWNLNYSGSYAERTSGPFGFSGFGQQLAVKGYVGARFTLYANAAIGFSNSGSASTAQQAELLRDLLGGKRAKGLRLGVSLGASRDWSNVASVFSRLTGSLDLQNWRFAGNLRLEKPFDDTRDKLDIVTSAGFHRHVGGNVFLGLEAVGQDLEGFWDKEEAEGGARLLLGPSLNICPANSRFSFTACGGPVFYATRSVVAPSQALRDLSTKNGYSFRAMVNFNLHR